MATYRVTYEDQEGVVFQMLFGDSYKPWKMQRDEYERLCETTYENPVRRLKQEKSYQSWIGMGGLKWCIWQEFQVCLDNEGDNRKVKDFIFNRYPFRRKSGRTNIARDPRQNSLFDESS